MQQQETDCLLPAKRVCSTQHGDSPSEEVRVKDIAGSMFQGLSSDASKLPDTTVDSAAAEK